MTSLLSASTPYNLAALVVPLPILWPTPRFILDMFNTGTQRPNWANGITLTSETTAEDVTNYINFKINEYTSYNFKDKSLWDLY